MKNMERAPAISVIIPIYNVDQFLRPGLESLTKQTMQDFEVILVDDGCTDSSREIMEEFAGRYAYFRIVSQRNSGVSAARNAGVNAARGEYIAFVDSDDFVKPDYLEKLYQTAQKTGADVTCCNYTLYYLSSQCKLTIPMGFSSRVYESDKILRSLIHDVRSHHFLWNKLWKRTLFTENDIDFPLGMYFEDVATTPRLVYFANKVAMINESLYYYIQRGGSILGSMNIQKINDYIRSLAVIRNFLEHQQVYGIYRKHFIFYGYKVILTNFYSIFREHLLQKTFTGMWTNFKASTKAVRYYISSRYIPQEGVGEFPCVVRPPERKTKKKKEPDKLSF